MEQQQSDAFGHAVERPLDDTVDRVGDLDAERTRLAPVDQVLDQVAALGDRPVDEHVSVFERAHEQLRRALDARPDA